MSNTPKTMVVALKSALDALVAEQTVVEASVGLGSSGAYQPDVGANYIANVTSVRDAMKELDTQLFSVATTYAPLTYVESQISSFLAAAPSTLDTLHEIATALGDDTQLYDTLTTQRTTEEQAARANESTIQASLTAQSDAAQVAEQLISTNLHLQSLAAQGAESTLTSNLSSENARSIGSVSTLSSIRFEEGATRSTVGFITTSTLQYNISVDLSGGLHDAIEAEMTRALNADTVISTALYNEVQRSIAAQAVLTSTITAEQLRAMTIEQSISTGVVNETTRATQAQSTLSGRISSIETTYVQKDGSVAFTGAVNLNSNRITNLSTGTTAATAATKAYVDQRISSLGAVFEYVGSLDASQVTNLDSGLPKTAETGDAYKITGAGTLSFNSGANTLSVAIRDLIVKNGQGGWDKITDKEMTLAPGSSGSNLTVTGSTNAGYTVDIASSYIGQPSLTTLGTVTTGTWNASTLATVKGGSGQATYTQGDLLVGTNTQSTLQKLSIGTSNTIVSALGNQVTYRGAESANIAIASTLNFANLSTTQQALEKLYDETQKRSFAQYVEGYTADYSDPLSANANWLSGKVNFIQPTTFVETRFEGTAFSASSASSIKYAHHAFDMLSTTTWQASQAVANSYIGATGVYQGSTLTQSIPTVDFNVQLATYNTTLADNTNGQSTGVDANKNIYVAYATTGAVSGKTRTGTSDIVVFKLNASGVLQWVKQESSFNTTGSNTNPMVKVDPSGNVVVAYYTSGNLVGKTRTGSQDIVVFSLDTDGALRWANQSSAYNSTGTNGFGTVDMDAAGNFFIAWCTDGTITGLTNRGGYDIVLAKFSTSGALTWVKRETSWNTAGNDSGYAVGSANLSVDPSGNCYVTYITQGQAVTGGTFLGQNDVIFFKANVDGSFAWAVQNNSFNTASYDSGIPMAIDNSNVFLLVNGKFHKINPATGAVVSTNTPSMTFPRNSAQWATWIKDVSGNFYLLFASEGGAGGGYSIGGWDISVYKYNVAGALLMWQSFAGTAYSTTSNDIVPSGAIDASGNIVLSFMSQGTVTGGTRVGDYDVVVTRLSQGGSMAGASTRMYGEWIQMSNATSYGLTKYSVRGASGRETTFTPTSFTLFGSFNTSNWNPVDAQSNLVFTSNEVKTFTLSSMTTSYPLYRLVITGVGSSAGNGSRTCAELAEMNLFTTMNAGASALYRRLGTDYYGASTITQSSGGNGSNALDYQSATYWSSSNAYNASTGAYTGANFTTNQPVLVYANQSSAFNSSAAESAITASAIDYDNSGNAYIAYTTAGTITGTTASGGLDVVVAKFNATGTQQWISRAATFNTSVDDTSATIAVNKVTGDVYVAYTTLGTITGETSTGLRDVAVLKLNASGVQQWVRQRNTFDTNQADGECTCTVDSEGSVIVAYSSSGSVSGRTNTGGTDIVLFKLAADGSLTWVKQDNTINTSSNDSLPYVTCDASDNILLGVMSQGTATGQTNAGLWDVIIYKLNSAGTRQWVTQTGLNSSVNDYQVRIATDASNNILVAYRTDGLVTGSEDSNMSDLVIAKLNSSGTRLWISQSSAMNTFGEDFDPTLAVDSEGYAYIGTYSTGAYASSPRIIKIHKETGAVLYFLYLTPVSSTSTNVSIRIDGQNNLYWISASSVAISGGTLVGSTDVVVAKYSQANLSAANAVTRYFGEWVQAKYTEGSAIKRYSLTPRSGYETTLAPTSWRVLGSMDGGAWDLVDTQTSQTFSANETKTYTLAANTLPYLFYRLVVDTVGTAAGSGSRTAVHLTDWSLYATVSISGGGGGDGSSYTLYLPPTNAGLVNGTILRMVHNGSSSDGNYVVSYRNTTTSSDVQVTELLAGQSMSFLWNGASSTYLNAIGI